MTDIAWGPAGLTVYERTYSRPKADGTQETWPETVARVVDGNLGLVYGEPDTWSEAVYEEAEELYRHIIDFKILPAGRHLWASGVKGRQFLMNCWTSGWTEKLSDHYEFTFMRLMEGGGVGANYSVAHIDHYGAALRELNVHIVCDPQHPDYQDMLDAGDLSPDYTADWHGAFEVEDSREGWAAALVDLLDTYMYEGQVKHENRVYDVTNVRGKGSRLKTFGGTASGPQPFAVMLHSVCDTMNDSWYSGYFTPLMAMEIDHAVAECVVSGGVRRSARMAQVHWKDPYIQEFIACKTDTDSHWTTNISVEIDDEFTELLAVGARDELFLHPLTELAKHVHDSVIHGMLTNGEPGYWNSSLSNHGELEPVYATNPCGEICLHPWEPCCLTHVNLDAFSPATASTYVNEGGLIRAHQLATRFALRATFGDITDDKSREITNSNRRIGVGHFGVQGFVVKNGYRYSEVAINERSVGYHWMRDLLARMERAVGNEAHRYAFTLRIPAPIKWTTVAPTGSISKLPGVTEGIHPIYARFYEQRIRFNMTDPRQAQAVYDAQSEGLLTEEDGYDKSGNTWIIVYPTKNLLVEQVEALGLPVNLIEQADELTIEQCLAFQAMYQRYYANNAVSYTVNVPEGLDHVETATTVARWLPVLKGTTIMVDGTREQAPFTRISQEEYENATATGVGDGIDEDCATGACPIR